MICSKCSREDHNYAEICFFCRCDLTYVPKARPKRKMRAEQYFRISRLAAGARSA